MNVSLSLDDQLSALRLQAGSGTIAHIGEHAHILWQYAARPTSLSRQYSLLLSYELGDWPEVFVMNPDPRRLAASAEVPHLYYRDIKGELLRSAKLCLFYPRYGEWQSSMLLADTVVPWSHMWLFYFEDWLASGRWKGGGVHPAVPPFLLPRRRRRQRLRADAATS